MQRVWCMMYHLWCRMYDVWCVMCDFDVWCTMWGVWRMMCDVWCMMHDVWWMMDDGWRMVYNVGCKMCGVWCVAHCCVMYGTHMHVHPVSEALHLLGQSKAFASFPRQHVCQRVTEQHHTCFCSNESSQRFAQWSRRYTIIAYTNVYLPAPAIKQDVGFEPTSPLGHHLFIQILRSLPQGCSPPLSLLE